MAVIHSYTNIIRLLLTELAIELTITDIRCLLYFAIFEIMYVKTERSDFEELLVHFDILRTGDDSDTVATVVDQQQQQDLYVDMFLTSVHAVIIKQQLSILQGLSYMPEVLTCEKIRDWVCLPRGGGSLEDLLKSRMRWFIGAYFLEAEKNTIGNVLRLRYHHKYSLASLVLKIVMHDTTKKFLDYVGTDKIYSGISLLF